MLFLMVFGRYPEKFSLGIFFPLRPDYRSNTIRLEALSYLPPYILLSLLPINVGTHLQRCKYV